MLWLHCDSLNDIEAIVTEMVESLSEKDIKDLANNIAEEDPMMKLYYEIF